MNWYKYNNKIRLVISPRDQFYVKGYECSSFVKTTDKNMSRNLSVKIVVSFLIMLNNLILTLLPFIEKNKSRVAEPTSDLAENKITDKITGTVTSNPKDLDIKIKV